MIDLLRQLMTESHRGDYRPIFGVIRQFLESHTQARIVVQSINETKANLIAVFGNGEHLINAHMDTVPPAGKWSVPIYEPTLRSARVYGLGACDTKGNIAALLAACRDSQPRNLMLLFSFDEESGKVESGVTHFLKSSLAQRIQTAIVCEPTENRIASRHPGYASFVARICRRAGHSSVSGVENAITLAAGLITRLVNADFQVNKIQGGMAGNIAASECEFKISCRNYQSWSENLTNIRTIAGQIPGLALKPWFKGPAFCNLSQCFIPNMEPIEVPFWSEAGLFQERGIATLIYGAGSIRQAHRADEWVNLQQLNKAYHFFIRRGKAQHEKSYT